MYAIKGIINEKVVTYTIKELKKKEVTYAIKEL